VSRTESRRQLKLADTCPNYLQYRLICLRAAVGCVSGLRDVVAQDMRLPEGKYHIYFDCDLIVYVLDLLALVAQSP
jgi:hypothetical protein